MFNNHLFNIRFGTSLLAIGCFALMFTLSSSLAHAEDYPVLKDTTNNGSPNLPRVYLDCDHCDRNYIREEIDFVNYVRDQKLADIHIFITSTHTGDGGREYTLSFLGRGRYEDDEFEMSFTTDQNATSDEERSKMVRILKKGLLPFMAGTPMEPAFSVNYEMPEDFEPQTASKDDPWNHWTFELYAGSLNLTLESNQKNFGSRWGIYADHVTEEWKARVRPYFNYHYEEISQGNDEPSVVSRQHRHGLNSFLIKSLNQHWSVGLFGDYLTRNDRNLRHDVDLKTGIEYSILPYSQATRKAITATYRIGYKGRDYYEETIFGKTEEHLVHHSLRIGSEIQQTWGELEADIEGSNYLHDVDKLRAQIFGRVSVRITEGFSVDFMTNYEIIQDQLSLPASESSLEDILLGKKELSTDYHLYTSIALTYTFGSEFTNVVNTRF